MTHVIDAEGRVKGPGSGGPRVLDKFGYVKGIALVDDLVATVGGGKDFATIQAAVDWFKGKLIMGSCKIAVDTGASYAEEVVIDEIFCAAEGSLEIEGDTRGMAGATWVDDAVITCQDANAGTGTCALANAGAVITVAGTGGNPDFDADDWVAGDTVKTRDNAGAIATYTIDSTLNNTITLTVAAPALGNTGTSVTLVPNTVIAPAGAGNAVEIIAPKGILLDGLSLDATAGATGHALYIHDAGYAQLENVLGEADNNGVWAQNSGVEMNDGACTMVGCTTALYPEFAAMIDAQYGVCIGGAWASWCTQASSLRVAYGVAAGCSAGGWGVSFFSGLDGPDSFALDCNDGYYASWMGGMSVFRATAQQNAGNGYYAAHMGYIYALNTNANNVANGADYSPLPGGFPGSAQGNVYGVIYAS